MLPRLRHYAVVRGNDQHGQVNGADAGHHGLDEALVPGHVDDRGLIPQKGKAEFNGNPPRPLFRGLVGIHAGQGLDQQGFAVVDVPSRANNSVRHLLNVLG